MKLRRPFKSSTLLVIMAVAVIVIGLYTWQSVEAWRGYERRLTAERTAFTDLTKTALSGDSPEKRLKALRTLDDKVMTRDTLCDMNGLYEWQASLIPALKEGMTTCESMVTLLDTVSKPLGNLRDYLDTGSELSAIVETLKSTGSFTEANWQTVGLSHAKKVQDDVKMVKASGDDAVGLKKQAQALTDTLVSKWESLIKANGAKDKTAFITSSAEVIKAYTDFTALADSSDTAIKAKVEALTAAYK